MSIETGEMVSLQIHLGIEAQKIIQRLQFHNQGVEEVVERAVTRAFKEMTESANFENAVVEATKRAFEDTIRQAANKYTVKWEIEKAISTAISKKIEEYASKIADKLTENLK